jgi:hypothetical protein
VTGTVETSPELASVTAELSERREEEAAMLARHLDEREGVAAEIKELEGRQAHLLAGTSDEDLRMARDLIEVHWVRTELHNEFDEQVVQEAVDDLVTGCLTMRSEYFCRRVYQGHLERETYRYGFGPRHGLAVFRIGLTAGAREHLKRWGKLPLGSDEEAKEAAIRYLLNLREAGRPCAARLR